MLRTHHSVLCAYLWQYFWWHRLRRGRPIFQANIELTFPDEFGILLNRKQENSWHVSPRVELKPHVGYSGGVALLFTGLTVLRLSLATSSTSWKTLRHSDSY